MKHFLALFAAVLLCSCAAPKSAPHFQDTAAAVGRAQQSNERANKQVVTAQTHTKNAQVKAGEALNKIQQLEKEVATNQVALQLAQGAHADVDALTKELNDTQAALTSAYTELGTTKGELGTAQYTIEQHEKEMVQVQKALDKAVIQAKKYHFLKWCIVMPLAGALMALLLWKFKALLLPLGAIGIGIMVGVPTLVLAFLAFKL